MRSLGQLQKPDLLAVPIATLLREAIFVREIRPGERIVERQLASQWNVSRAPLREAIKQLTTEGLLVVSPHRGASVREVSKKELTELFAVREMIEVAAVRIAARLGADTDLTRMQELVDAMRAAASRGDLPTFSGSGLAFHDELVRLSKNETMIQIYDGVKLRFRRYQFLLAALPDVPQSSTVAHQEILSAIRMRDADAASACVTRHLAHLVARFSEGEGHFAERMVDHRPINRHRNERVGLT